MPNEFNLTKEALRKLMVCLVDVSESTDTPEWEAQGYKTEDASLEFNPDSTTVTDVLGDTYTDLNKFEESITFEPNTLRMGAKLSELLHKYWRDGDHAKYSQFKVAIVYGYLGTAGSYEADVWKASTIYPNSLGGSSRVDFPFTITMGGERVKAISTDLRSGTTITEAI